MDDAGSSAVDTLGDGTKTITINGATPQNRTGPFGERSIYTFDGVNDYGSVPSAYADFGKDEGAIAGWFYNVGWNVSLEEYVLRMHRPSSYCSLC